MNSLSLGELVVCIILGVEDLKNSIGACWTTAWFVDGYEQGVQLVLQNDHYDVDGKPVRLKLTIPYGTSKVPYGELRLLVYETHGVVPSSMYKSQVSHSVNDGTIPPDCSFAEDLTKSAESGTKLDRAGITQVLISLIRAAFSCGADKVGNVRKGYVNV